MIEANPQQVLRRKPPESRKNKSPADKDSDWRKRAAEEVEEERETRESRPIENRAYVELPYVAVPPVINRSEDQPDDYGKQLTQPDIREYQVRAPVQREGLGRALADKVLRTEVTLDIRDLAGVSPEVRETIRKDLTKSRKPIRPDGAKRVMFADELEPALPFQDEEEELQLEYDALNLSELPRVASAFVQTAVSGDLPQGAIAISDPYLQYLESLGPDETPRQVYVEPKQVYVAKDAADLRTVYPAINMQGRVECVMDSGSQIVSMSLEQALACKLYWDPDITIYMQSANRSLEKSVGLARNVPFKFGEITVYLQVHIIRGPAYKVLLGRPFEVLTECQINNNRDESQTVTLKDPNTGRRCTMATFPRAKENEAPKKSKVTVEEVEDEERPSKTADPADTKQGFRQASMT